ncbi:DUF3592 domain-containing protein [Haloferula rosea]|uniref:DUF3592 domain-containing protein n=1 Tax=Haloferula rosea TaxID=490093 RepID=A0A934RHV5_9BACT|nr:DUF3592 domain-containing protein [Haloferula rosea]MBK1828600.1 DUF3592 domain-containing protein [Haloferula rosea]
MTARKSGEKMSRGCGMLFGIGWTAFSSIFVAVGLFAFWSGVKTRTWEEVPCKILKFEIIDVVKEDPPFKVELAYRYSVDGKSYTGTQLKAEFKGEEQYEDLAEIEDRIYGGGEGSVCWVNPDDPTDAVLFHGGGDSWFGLIFVAFGGGFVLIGLGLIFSAWREGNPKKAVTEVGDGEADGKLGGLLGCGFFGVFAAVGVGMLLGLVVPTGYRYFAVKGWVETPAEVVWSRVRESSGDDGPTYRADIFYSYQFEGRSYRSNGYSLTGGGGSSGRDGKLEIVEAHPKGKAITCYVNPKQPREALLNRSLGWWALFGLFPLPFAAIGLGGLYATFIRKEKPAGKKAKTGKSDRTPLRIDRSPPSRKGSTVGKRLLHVLGAIAIAAFWNGITSVFVWQVFKGWRDGDSPWFLTLFMLPFVAVGIGLIIHVFYRIVAVFSPIYVVEIGDDTMSPGSRTSVSWRRRGGYGSPRRLSVWLIGREEATYRRGTDTTTSTELFYEESLFETEVSQMMPAGRCRLDLPEDAVPTFAGKHNKLQWFVVLVADVPRRPDVRDEYEIVVTPQGRSRS